MAEKSLEIFGTTVYYDPSKHYGRSDIEGRYSDISSVETLIAELSKDKSKRMLELYLNFESERLATRLRMEGGGSLGRRIGNSVGGLELLTEEQKTAMENTIEVFNSIANALEK